MSQSITMLTKAWYGDEPMTIDFPDSWEVVYKKMPGHDTPGMTDEQIWEAINSPIGAPKLQDLARGKQRVVIVFDDLARPAPAYRVVPFILKILAEAGIKDEQIRFIAGVANHLPMHRDDYAKKLGEDIPGRFRIYNHNPYEHFVDLGKTSRGTHVLINREFMSCDLKIAIGGIIPHPSAGFGGGAKIIVPGVVSYQTVLENHIGIGNRGGKRNPTVGQGKVDGNEVRLDMEEVARMSGLDWKIDIVINGKREPVGVFCGDVVAEHRVGVDLAWKTYGTPCEKEYDVVVANSYPIDLQVHKGIWPAVECMKDGGSAVVLCNSVQGESLHYQSQRFGTDYGGGLYSPDRARRLPTARRIYYFTEFPSRIQMEMLGAQEQVVACRRWSEVIMDLVMSHGAHARVAVFPCASAQLPAKKGAAEAKEPAAAGAGASR
ncbi:MAG: lactate racemase domain-containing protein [Bacteroidetes bacterium]|nr:lactate racemase domain-containing protein [Bacteroidota bacterium]MCL5026379.1 lactate racemase domain-containing protein [Chloroflexota bacterium]